MNALALELKDVETGRIIAITLDAAKIDPSWKAGTVVRIDIDDTGTDPESLYGVFEIMRGLGIEYTDRKQ